MSDKLPATIPFDETCHVRQIAEKYCQGRGADLGCGYSRVVPTAIAIDFDFYGLPKPEYEGEVYIPHDLNQGLSMFRDEELDYVYSSHVLEDFSDPETKLQEWVRVVKPGGYLVLVLPHEDFYPKVGTPGASPHHRLNWSPTQLLDMVRACDLPLVLVEVHTPYDLSELLGEATWSFFAAYKKR